MSEQKKLFSVTGWKFWLFLAAPWVIGVITIVRWF